MYSLLQLRLPTYVWICGQNDSSPERKAGDLSTNLDAFLQSVKVFSPAQTWDIRRFGDLSMLVKEGAVGMSHAEAKSDSVRRDSRDVL